MWNPLSFVRANSAPDRSRFLSGVAKSVAIGIALGLHSDGGQSGERFTTSIRQSNEMNALNGSPHDMAMRANRDELISESGLDLSFG